MVILMIWIGVTLACLAYVLVNISQAPKIEGDVAESDGPKPHRSVVEKRAGRMKRVHASGPTNYYIHRSE
ncbi:hypothetical protein [Roseiconus lacunae]|uniref:Uncharacterized protein n=1 Tax=Roseiconus lacunae TaxID=2605694 RepID=A0ABT7PKR5_9BACT|nr:hypothetical protein [Roseiconus lacunae]MDM4016886.1 hypothetical protein [Roseiconus lacunae]